MADSIRQSIVNAVDARLKTIKIANGYETDIGLNVNRWKAIPVSSDKEYELIYRDVSCETVYLEAHRHKLHFEVEAIIKAGSISDNQVRKMLADILKAIGVDPQWSNLAINTHPEGDEINILQTEKIIGGTIIRFAIEFRTKEWDPYTTI
jgi:hypothetical protein